MFDRYDAATERCGVQSEDAQKLDCLREAMSLLVDPAAKTDRAENFLTFLRV